MKLHRCRVVDKQHPVRDCTTLVLEPLDGAVFTPRAGQHLVVELTVDGEALRRCYSVHDGPFCDAPVAITVRRIEGGRVSNVIFDALSVGDEIRCSAPTGRFALDPEPLGYRHVYLYAAGTGITPLLAMAEAALRHEPHSFVSLLYGNRNRSRMLFGERLDAMLERWPHRFTVDHVMSNVWSDWSVLRSFDGEKGRIDAERVEAFLGRHPPRAQTVDHYICGPDTMNDAVHRALLELGARPERIYVEAFGSPRATAPTVTPCAAKVSVRWPDGSTATADVPAGLTVLEGLRAAGLAPPSACEVGICGTCAATMTEGEVHPRSSMALDAREQARGMVLTCQALPISPAVGVRFDD